jgi:hypothetical protein
MNFIASIILLILSLASTTVYSQPYTDVIVQDLGLSFEVPADWYTPNVDASRKMDAALSILLNNKNRPQNLITLISHKDINSLTSSSISVLYQPDSDITQDMLAKASYESISDLCIAIKKEAEDSIRQLAHRSSVEKHGVITRKGDSVFIGLTMLVQMKPESPEKLKEILYYFSNKGTIQFTFNYMKTHSLDMDHIRNYMLESLRLDTFKRAR